MEEEIREVFRLLCIRGIDSPDGVWKTGFATLDIVKDESKDKGMERLQHFSVFVVTVIF